MMLLTQIADANGVGYVKKRYEKQQKKRHRVPLFCFMSDYLTLIVPRTTFITSAVPRSLRNVAETVIAWFSPALSM